MKTVDVLVIEDEPYLRKAYEIMLTAKNYTVRTAENGLQGLEELNKKPLPDLIFLDMLMPRMDGLGFLKASKITEKHPEIAVILFSNFSNSHYEDDLAEFNISEKILKSTIGPADLVNLVKKYTDT